MNTQKLKVLNTLSLEQRENNWQMLEIVKNYHTQLSNRKAMILRKTKRRNITCAEINYTALAKKKKRLKNSLKEERLSMNQLLFLYKTIWAIPKN